MQNPAVTAGALVHIVDDGGAWVGADAVVAICGARGEFNDGELVTTGYDFVEPPDEDSATCKWCRETRGLGGGIAPGGGSER